MKIQLKKSIIAPSDHNENPFFKAIRNIKIIQVLIQQKVQ